MDKSPLILFQDEARFGRIGDTRKSWAPKGTRPFCPSQFVREYLYIYSAVAPIEGEMFTLILPEVSTEAMNVYLRELSTNYIDREILMFLDQAGWHKSKQLDLPKNITIDYLPPYSPELNPQENVWNYFRTNSFANIYTDSLEKVENILMKEIPLLAADTNKIKSIAGYNWIINSVLNAN